MAFVVAHLSDPHLAPLPRPRPRELASKRVLGYLNWKRGRNDVHTVEALERIVADVAALAPDHVVVTGDLTNISLDAEFDAARAWLERLGPPDRVTVVPGNHDAYVAGALERGIARWRDYVEGDPGARDGRADPFPSIRRRGPVAFVGLSSAIATGPFMATGRIGGRQLVQLADDLVGLGREGLARIVLVHHPLHVSHQQLPKRLLDAGAMRTVLSAAGAELVLHGHLHIALGHDLPGPRGPIPVIGVPSASADPLRARHGAGYAVHRITVTGEDGFAIETERRELSDTGEVVSLGAATVSVARARA